MAQLLIRNLDPAVLERLRRRARAYGRSLEAELRDILSTAAAADISSAKALAARIRRRLSGRVHSDSGALRSEDHRS
jgi:plasmid stability protein